MSAEPARRRNRHNGLCYHSFDHKPRQCLKHIIVGLTCLEHGASCRSGVTTTLEDHTLEEGLIGIAVHFIGAQQDRVVGTEFIHNIGAGADGVEVFIGTFLGGSTLAVFKLGFLKDR